MKESVNILKSKRRMKDYTKAILKYTSVIILGIFIILSIIYISFKPVYKVTLDGEEIGYVTDKNSIEQSIDEYINDVEGTVAFKRLSVTPDYKYELVKRNTDINETQVLDIIKSKSINTYLYYAVRLDDEVKGYVSSIDEAETLVSQIKSEYQKIEEYNKKDLNLMITKEYTEDANSLTSKDSTKANIDEKLSTQLAEINKIEKQKELEASMPKANGILLASAPTKVGSVSSRFGSRWGKQHGGIDIAAAYGTPIYAVASGTVDFAGFGVSGSGYGGYGNVVKISHGNGVETIYGHCSKLNVTKGQKVQAGDVIGAVGSTGDSTGNHLHFEIRINGTKVNPQNYLYKK